jgi:hypothetical protein
LGGTRARGEPKRQVPEARIAGCPGAPRKATRCPTLAAGGTGTTTRDFPIVDGLRAPIDFVGAIVSVQVTATLPVVGARTAIGRRAMDVQDELLQRFARMIDLPAFVGQQGFELAKHQEPDRLRMTRAATGKSILLEKNVERGGWSYVNAADPTDRGNVVDFVMRRDGVSQKACVDRLFACCDERGRGSAEALRYRALLRAMPEDLAGATRDHEQAKRAELAAAKALEYLGVRRGTFDEWRFGSVKRRTDVAELANEPSALWASKYRPGDKAVVLVERPIDAVAYERAHGRQNVCYLATGSHPSDEQRRRLAHVLAEVPNGARVVLAYGRDGTGRQLAAEVQSLVPLVRMERHAPQFGARWADQMQLERNHALSLRKVGPAIGR